MKCREPNIKYEKGMDRTEAEEKREKRKQEPILVIRFAGTYGRTNGRTDGRRDSTFHLKHRMEKRRGTGKEG